MITSKWRLLFPIAFFLFLLFILVGIISLFPLHSFLTFEESTKWSLFTFCSLVLIFCGNDVEFDPCFSSVKWFLMSQSNSSSGVAVNDACKLKFLELKSKRNYRFIVFKINSATNQVEVENAGSHDSTYEDFAESLPANECRYAVFDYEYTTNENCHKTKIYFIAWSPETAMIRHKMLYASSKDRFKRELDGIQVELQATDPSEMSLDTIKSRAL